MYNESVYDSCKRSLRNVTDVVTPMLADMVDKTIRVHKNLYRLKKTVNSKMAAVNFGDETAELLETTCVELAHAVLWMYYSKDFFDEFQFVNPKDYDKMVLALPVSLQPVAIRKLFLYARIAIRNSKPKFRMLFVL